MRLWFLLECQRKSDRGEMMRMIQIIKDYWGFYDGDSVTHFFRYRSSDVPERFTSRCELSKGMDFPKPEGKDTPRRCRRCEKKR